MKIRNKGAVLVQIAPLFISQPRNQNQPILKNPTKTWFSTQDHAVLLLLFNIVGFFISARQKSACWKWFVPQLYQPRRGILKGPALKYFYMGGRPPSKLKWQNRFRPFLTTREARVEVGSVRQGRGGLGVLTTSSCGSNPEGGDLCL